MFSFVLHSDPPPCVTSPHRLDLKWQCWPGLLLTHGGSSEQTSSLWTHTHTPVDRLQVQEKHLHPHCSSFLLWHSSDGRPRCHISLWDSTTITQCPSHPLLPLCEGGEPAVEWRKGEAFASWSSQSTANQTHTDIFSVSIVTFHKNIYYVLLSCLLPWTDVRFLCYQIQMMSSKLIYFPDITINIMCEYQHFKDIKSWALGSCCFLSDNVMVI